MPIPSGTNILVKLVLLDSTPKAIIRTPNIWHNDTKRIGISAIATSVTQNANILEKKSLYCKTWNKFNKTIYKRKDTIQLLWNNLRTSYLATQ